MSSSTPIFISNLSEERWIKHIAQHYTKNPKISTCVFKVPQNMRDTKPEAYTPQLVGLGPFHHFLPEVQQMEGQKCDAVKEHINRKEYEDFIKLLTGIPGKFEPTVRSSYDRFLDLGGDTLSCIMVVDGIFLLHVINKYLDKKEYGGLVPDIFMLENQIPLKVLKQIQKALKRTFSEATDVHLFDKITRFCEEQSPLKLSEDAELRDQVFEKHILHYMYKLIVGNYDPQISDSSASEQVEEEPQRSAENSTESCSATIRDLAKQTAKKVTTFGKQIAELTQFQEKDVLKQVGDSVNSRIDRLSSSGVEIPDNVQKTVKFLQRLQNTSNLRGGNQANFFANEIDVPSVSQLKQIAEIKFERTDGGIKNVWFDTTSNTLYLPVITLRANSEVILRNLVAYEAASAEPVSTLELSDYLDLMCGIIDTEKDVELLKGKIIEGDLSNEEIVSIFNGIDKLGRPDKNSKVQSIVRKVNEQFDNIGIVKAYKSFKKFLGGMQDLFNKLFPLLVLILLTLQYVCDVRGCSSRGLGYAAVRWDSLGDGSSLSLDSQANYFMIPRKMLRYAS